MIQITSDMTKNQIQAAKWLSLSEMKMGDKLKLTNGQVCEFIRLKDKKFIGAMDGKNYDIPVMMFVELIEKAKQAEDTKEYLTLKKGELFYINDNKGNAMLFKFDEIRNGKIVGINPITKGTTKIDCGLYVGKVSSL